MELITNCSLLNSLQTYNIYNIYYKKLVANLVTNSFEIEIKINYRKLVIIKMQIKMF